MPYKNMIPFPTEVNRTIFSWMCHWKKNVVFTFHFQAAWFSRMVFYFKHSIFANTNFREDVSMIFCNISQMTLFVRRIYWTEKKNLYQKSFKYEDIKHLSTSQYDKCVFLSNRDVNILSFYILTSNKKQKQLCAPSIKF